MTFIRTHWTTYLFTGFLVLFFTWTISFTTGCKLGNNFEPPAVLDPSTATDPEASYLSTLTGYYRLVPNGLNFCSSFLSNPTVPTCKTSTTDRIPTLISTILTNPVALQVQNSDNGYSVMFSPTLNNNKGLGIYINSSNLALSYNETSSSATLWDDPNCTTSLTVDQVGGIDRNLEEGSLSGFTLSGSIALSIMIVQGFHGPCTATFESMMACYHDPNDCGGTNESENLNYQLIVQNFFAPYLESGAIVEADIPNLAALAYEASYQ